ncbi:MAG: hypothetical protein QW244_03060 [Candidatus Pacearchaeota archaeon]
MVINNFAFDPPELIVDADTEVIWRQEDDVVHNIVSDENLFMSDVLKKRESNKIAALKKQKKIGKLFKETLIVSICVSS